MEADGGQEWKMRRQDRESIGNDSLLTILSGTRKIARLSMVHPNSLVPSRFTQCTGGILTEAAGGRHQPVSPSL